MWAANTLQRALFALLYCYPLLALTSAAPTTVTSGPGAGSHPDLVQLTAANWTQSINHGAWLIEFYSPFCAHCKAFLPLWMELTKNKADLATDYPDAPFQLAQVNCYAQRQLCVDQQVPHFPRLTVYRDGKQSQAEYQGDREYTELAKWIDEEAKLYRQIKAVSHVPHPIAPAGAAGAQPAASPEQPPIIGPAKPVTEGPAAAPLMQGSAQPAAAQPSAPIGQPQPQSQPLPPSPPPPPASPPAAVAEPESPPPIDESLPNPRGQLLQYGITPGLTTIEQLREWLGVPANAEDYGMNYAQTNDKPITAENTNEGSHGTGSKEKSPGFGGARLNTTTGASSFTALGDRKSTISKGGTFVKFFAPWCPHCKAMAQAFEKLAPELKNQLNILEVDCQANQKVCRSFHVSSYPTLRLYSPANRLVSEYRGSRSFDKMRDWCRKAAEEEVVDLYEARDERHWDEEIARREEVRFLWLSDEPRDDTRDAWERERQLVTLSSKVLFTSPFRVYRSSHQTLLRRFESRLAVNAGGYRSALLAFRDHKADRPVAAYHVHADSQGSARGEIEKWLDWNRYPTLSSVGGESWVDVMNNAHGAPVVLALLSEEHHDGEELPLGSGSAKRRAEIAALKRMAIAWREEGWQFRRDEAARGDVKFSSNGGLLWGWMDADRWRKAIKTYYGLSPQSFPALLLVDNSRLVYYYPLPTNRPAQIVNLKTLDPLPSIPMQLFGGGDDAAGAAAHRVVSEWQSKMSYLGESSEVSTWLGRGGAAPDEILATLPANSSTLSGHIIDDLSLLPFISSIATGAHSNLARSSRSYLDRGFQSIEALVLFAARHWFLAIFFVVAVVALLAVYVKSHVGDSDGRGYYHKGGIIGNTKAD